ncbi:MAG TPA: hypothetical protein VH370_19680 [Humisphaera sp.]|jgi:hypothetical protein|nr:hypothetical protein [Humisphaera sp.]
MNAIRIEKRLDSHVLPELIPLIGKQVEIIVLEQAATERVKGPKAGSAKGKVTISPDFDEPLQEFAHTR